MPRPTPPVSLAGVQKDFSQRSRTSDDFHEWIEKGNVRRYLSCGCLFFTEMSSLNRRQLLALIGGSTTVLAGCTFRLGKTPPPEVVSKRIQSTGSVCVGEGEGRQRATTSYDSQANQLLIEGTIKAQNPCPDLLITSADGEQSHDSNAVHLAIETHNHGNCDPCSAETFYPAVVHYSAEVTFDHNPPIAYVYHIEKKIDKWVQGEPVATESIR